jgi:hypothetical protein
MPAAAIGDGHPASFYLSMVSPVPYSTLGFVPTGHEREQVWCQGADGSTFAVATRDDATTMVAAEGPLWAALETAYQTWETLGRPGRDRFGVTATANQQWVWLDSPDEPVVHLAR